MFLNLAHTNLDVYKYSYSLTLELYRLTKRLPDSEKFNLISQLRRAALSVYLNIANKFNSQLTNSSLTNLPLTIHASTT